MRKPTPREIVLLVVVGGLAIIGWAYGRGGPLGGGRVGEEELEALSFGDPPVVELTRLILEPESVDAATRNLFSYYTPPPPPRPAAPPPVVRAPVVAPPTDVVTQAPPRAAPPIVEKAPRPNFRYIGFMGPKDNKIAVLEKGDEVILAAVGEIVDKQYKILEFKYEMLVLGYTAERWADETAELPMKR